ncbi:hypothetical protein E3N88_06897 [Mikania micrantha]|uniref:Uncharacterized protein n=1 Tax=Mikania micrantha TaxID=192012 RepID=A0A5N6PQR4_9ASTR|nr:hypothetical protein E3N88_06897 [Mikania micrantha]
MSRIDDHNREIRENRFETTKLSLLGFSGTHRGTRWPNRSSCRGTRQTSRRVDSRIPSRSAKHLSGLVSRARNHSTIFNLQTPVAAIGSH